MEIEASPFTSEAFEKWLCCPREHAKLSRRGSQLICTEGHSYDIVDGVPVMLVKESDPTLWVADASLSASASPSTTDPVKAYHLDTLGISPAQVEELERLIAKGTAIDPVVAMLVAATNGISYKHLVGKLESYPIPALRLPEGHGKRLLDVGCSWGRWSIAAARKGYEVVGIDPSLGAVLAAQRVARAHGLRVAFVCADARYLPFRPATFSVAFSYSVLQHFSKSDARTALTAMRRVLEPGGTALVQMPNAMGVRCLQHQARRRFREPGGFEVRYWTTRELRRTFEAIFGDARLEIDCFFGLGLQASDRALMRKPLQRLIDLSESLRALSAYVKPLVQVADSVYVRARAA